MFSALKKLTRGGDERAPGAAPARMPSSLQKKFSRGVHYNMKILIKGDRNVGKSCLLQRLQGGPFIEDYIPTEQIQAAAIHWTYKNTDHIVKVEVWEVVDKARSKKRAPLGLKLDNAAAAGAAGDGDDDAPALDATFLDVYKDASGVILMMDITKPWTFEYVVKELSNVPADLPLILLGNHCDMQHHRQVHPHHLEEALQQARHTRTAPVRYAEASMRNGFGLRLLHKFLSVPFLRLQRATLLQQLQRNQLDARDADHELDQFQSSEESNYVLFVERLASKRRAGAGAGAAAVPAGGDRSPSIVLGAGKPILPPNTNPLHAMSLSSPLAQPDSPQAARRTQSQYVSAELLAPTSPPPQPPPPPPPPAHSRRAHDSPRSSTSAAAGALDEFYAGALDTSFLEDAGPPPPPPGHDHHAAHDTDSDNDNSGNPMVASTQDDLDELEGAGAASPFAPAAHAPGGERARAKGAEWDWRGSLEVERLMSRASLAGGGGDAAAAGGQFDLWAGAARRSPEGGEDPSVSTEPHSVKEERKHKKSKKSKDKEKEEGGDKSRQVRDKKHKHKKTKSERRDAQHPQCGLLLPTEPPASADQYDSI